MSTSNEKAKAQALAETKDFGNPSLTSHLTVVSGEAGTDALPHRCRAMAIIRPHEIQGQHSPAQLETRCVDNSARFRPALDSVTVNETDVPVPPALGLAEPVDKWMGDSSPNNGLTS